MGDRRSQMKLVAGYYLGYHATLLIELGVRRGLFAALARRVDGGDARALADDLGLHAPFVEHFLRAAFALALVDRVPSSDRYRLAPHMESILADRDSSSYLGSLARLQSIAARDIERMEELLASGGLHPYQAHDDDLIDAVAESTEGIARFLVRRVIPGLPGVGGRDDAHVLDLGCGSGGALVALGRAFPRGRVLGVDVESRSVERAQRRIRAAGLEGRAEARLLGAECIEEVESFDLVTLIQVLHETREEVRETILERAHAALRSDGHLIVIDEPYPDDPAELRNTPFTALQQWVEIFWGNAFLSIGGQRRLLERVGFEIVSQLTLPPGLLCATLALRR